MPSGWNSPGHSKRRLRLCSHCESSLNGLMEMVGLSVSSEEILRSEAAKARFECARDRWIAEHAYICREHAVMLGEQALEEHDVDVAVLFYRYALELLEGTARSSRERERRWRQMIEDGRIPEDARPRIGVLPSWLMLKENLWEMEWHDSPPRCGPQGSYKP